MKYCIICYQLKHEGIFAHYSCLEIEHMEVGILRSTVVWNDEEQGFMNT